MSDADECLGKPARYWYDAFRIAEGLRADAERRVEEYKRANAALIATVEVAQRDAEIRRLVEASKDRPPSQQG